MNERRIWNWQQKDWPHFRYDPKELESLESAFMHQSGLFTGTIKHIEEDDKQQLTIALISDEAFNTSEIEGEILNRESLQSSIRRNFGLSADKRKVPPAEQGISQMMVDLYRNFNVPLTHKALWGWHGMLMTGNRKVIGGRYRSGEEAMQVVSGPVHEPIVHYEAPPASILRKEMAYFNQWFNQTAPDKKASLPTLTRAGIAHWHFVCIHPFEDGNGRIARAIAEKALSQGLGHPTLIALSHIINGRRKAYYEALAQGNRHNEITVWLRYFAKAVLEAQTHTQRMVDFLIQKTKFFARFRDQLNERQEKVILRVFREGPDGFKGGLSAEKYIRITKAPRATTTRDLQDLVEKGILTRKGMLKSTRYFLMLLKGVRY